MSSARASSSSMKNQSAHYDGASAGLGRALAFRIGTARCRSRIGGAWGRCFVCGLSRKIRAAEPGRCALALPFDIAEKDSVYRIVGQAAAARGAIDLLVNNASTLGPVPLQHLADTDCEDFSRALAVNVIAPFRLSKALVGHMVLHDAGTSREHFQRRRAVEPYAGWGAFTPQARPRSIT